MHRLAVFALLAGCSGDIDFAHFPDALTDARCSYFIRCGLVSYASECVAYYKRIAVDNPSTQAAIDMGKTTYHPDVAQACFDAYAALSCDQSQLEGDELDVCNGVLTGNLAIGNTCAFDKECESENCVVPSCQDACCTGTCAAPETLPAVGQPCTALCAGDAYCGLDSICHAPLPQNAACNQEPCAYGLYCAGRTQMMSGTCKPLPKLGMPCETVCAELGAVCYAGSCVEVGLLGDACTSNAQCSSFYECRAMQCSLLPTLGMPCETSCYEAAYCDGNTCVAQKNNGVACVRNDECGSHYCMRSGSTGSCAEPPLCI